MVSNTPPPSFLNNPWSYIELLSPEEQTKAKERQSKVTKEMSKYKYTNEDEVVIHNPPLWAAGAFTYPYVIPEVAFDALGDGMKAVNNAGFECYVIGGTLLGLIRDSAFIEGDNDLDIGVKANPMPQTIIPELEKLGFNVERFQYHCGHGKEGCNCKSSRKLVKMRCVRDGFLVDIQCSEISVNMPIQTFTLKNGRTYWVPSPPEKWLDNRFGSKWRIPTVRSREH